MQPLRRLNHGREAIYKNPYAKSVRCFQRLKTICSNGLRNSVTFWRRKEDEGVKGSSNICGTQQAQLTGKQMREVLLGAEASERIKAEQSTG